MAHDDHVKPEDYLAVLRGELPAGWLHEHSHRHLMEVCADCRANWHDEGSPRPIRTGGEDTDDPNRVWLPDLPADRRATSLAEVEVTRRYAAASREAGRCARDDLSRLLKLPPAKWRKRVERSQTRFRSRQFAELLIEESRARVRTAAAEAATLASLVVPALDRLPGRLAQPWAQALAVRAEAHRANALRVAGDLPAAATAIAALRRQLMLRPLGDPLAMAEVHSLEASLWIGRRDTQRAEQLLQSALAAFETAGKPLGVARTQVKLANLLQAEGRAEEVAPLLERAAPLVDRETEPHLYRCILHGRLTALIDLERLEDAEELVLHERESYRPDGDAHSQAAFNFLRARIDLGCKRYAAAEAGFTSARDQLLAVDRSYDAILASLYLADALLAAGKHREVRELAAGLVPLFRSRGVARETLASLRLLAEAAQREAVTATLVAEVRSRLHAAPAGGRSTDQD